MFIYNQDSIVRSSPKVQTTQCPSTDKWINRMWCVCTVGWHSAIRRKDLWHTLPHGWTLKTCARWQKTDTKEKCWFHLYEIPRINRFIKTAADWRLPEAGDGRGYGFKGTEFLSEMVEKFRNSGDDYTTVNLNDATELYTWKWLPLPLLCYLCDHNFLKTHTHTNLD